jgi:hypothetical protein
MIKVGKKTLAVTSATLAIAGMGAAYAWLGNSSDGTGSTDQLYLTVDTPGAPDHAIRPGDNGMGMATFPVKITNQDADNPHTATSFEVRIVNINGSDWSYRPTGSTKPLCTQADFDVMPDDPATITVPADGTYTAHFRVQFHDRPWDQSSCLGLTNQVPFHVTIA